MTLLKPKMKSRIPKLFCLKYRYGMGIFTNQIVLLDTPFKNILQTRTNDLKLQQGQ
jgi:hypothetical protein